MKTVSRIRINTLPVFVVAAFALAVAMPSALAEDIDEFKIKRQHEFAFAAEPTLSVKGDDVTIRFATTALCDVTVVIEDGSGRIRRHLASGVLGENAPQPLVKNSRQQTIVWDGKDDQGRYLDNLGQLRVRVSLGLRPQFERVLFWSPKKRVARSNRPLVAATEQGVLVFEGEGLDHVRQFDHQGNYLKTVYPFAADKLKQVKGLQREKFPQDGQLLPLKHGIVQATLLTSGKNVYPNGWAKYQPGATAMAAVGGRIALAMERLNRLADDGTTGGLSLEGAATAVKIVFRNEELLVPPRSAAFSPDGKWLYLTGFHFKPRYPRPNQWLPCVTRVAFAEDAEMEIFVGSPDLDRSGTEAGEFRVPTSVACDGQGRVYVTDYMNDRVQVFSPEGKHLGAVPVTKPTQIAIDQKTGQLYVGSWMLLNQYSQAKDVPAPTIARLSPFPQSKQLASFELPLTDHNPNVFMNKSGGFQYEFALDAWTTPPTIWLVPALAGTVDKLLLVRGKMDQGAAEACIRLLVEKDGKLVETRNFGKEVVDAVVRAKPPIHSRQKMYVNPVNGKLYVFEGAAGVSKSALDLLEMDPLSGEIKPFPLKFDAEDLAFDTDGLIYLRTDNVVGRFDPVTWREVPFDYGEERKSVGFSSSRDGRRADLVGGLVLPSQRPGCFHQGGMHVSSRGNLVVACYNAVKPPARKDEQREILEAAEISAGRQYTPRMYPGRFRYNEVHVWDRHGEVLYEDALPGAPMMDGIAMDANDNIYAMITPNRVLDGEPYFLERAETLIKVAPQQAKVLSSSERVPVPLEPKPDRPAELVRSSEKQVWIQGRKWLYGGVGFGGFNSSKGGGGCACWHARFALDTLGRSFAPEVDHYSVAVLDTAGNLITRIGKYGNADSAGPDSRVPLGGDEVGLFHAAYVATHTDHRLFIADAGNSRIVSVKLGYHTEKTVSLNNTSGK